MDPKAQSGDADVVDEVPVQQVHPALMELLAGFKLELVVPPVSIARQLQRSLGFRGDDFRCACPFKVRYVCPLLEFPDPVHLHFPRIRETAEELRWKRLAIGGWAAVAVLLLFLLCKPVAQGCRNVLTPESLKKVTEEMLRSVLAKVEGDKAQELMEAAKKGLTQGILNVALEKLGSKKLLGARK